MAVLWTACASEPARTPAVRVRVGAIDPAASDAAGGVPGSIAEGIEQLVDLFWQRGCRGSDLSLRRRHLPDTRYPDVVCRLPGRTPDTVVVAAYVDPRSNRGEDWTGPALLPALYAALSVEAREHSFVFVGFTRRSRRGVREDAKRLEEARLDRIRALVDLQQLRGGSSEILFASSDPRLRKDLAAVGLAEGQPGESLRLIALPDRIGSSRQRSRIPTLSMGSPDPAGEGAASGVRGAGDREQFRSAARTLAVFLGYLDGTLRALGDPSATDAGG